MKLLINEFRSIYQSNSEDEGEELKAFWSEAEEKPAVADLTRRRLYRVFNHGSFDLGGRFYGGWWQNVPSRYRPYITINWYATRELDFSNMQPAMLYAREGLELEGDAYAIEGIDPRYRKLVKTTLMKLINARPEQRISPPRKGALPLSMDWNEWQQAVIERHAPIARYLRSGIGLELQRMDSDIAEQVMHSMMTRNILVLPIHDSFIVRSGFYRLLKEEMRKAYKQEMNRSIGIKMDGSFLDMVSSPADIGEFVTSLFRDIEDDLVEEDDVRYQSYYRRKRDVQATKDLAWFYKYEI